jgi:hypothetical protein
VGGADSSVLSAFLCGLRHPTYLAGLAERSVQVVLSVADRSGREVFSTFGLAIEP